MSVIKGLFKKINLCLKKKSHASADTSLLKQPKIMCMKREKELSQ